MAGKVVLFEGLDLAGKSTQVVVVSDELRRRGLAVRCSRNALCPENPVAPLADRIRREGRAGLIETGSLFLASHLWDARNFTPPPDGMIHLQDSCWLRTLAYNCHRGTPGIPELLLSVVDTMPRFHLTVFLTASIEERRRRLQARETERPGSNDTDDHLVVTAPERFLEAEATLRDWARRLTSVVELDTTTIARADLTNRIINLLAGI